MDAQAAHELRLDILGTSFSITADEDPAYLEEIFSRYRAAVENTQAISGMQDPLRVAILTGFLLCDEVNKARKEAGEEREKAEEQQADEERELERRTRSLIERLDQALIQPAVQASGSG
jgi:cell division protein ZapA (FtsZ GTPase activity inhibitor)